MPSFPPGSPFEDFFKQFLVKKSLVNEKDLGLYLITDDEDKILDVIRHAPVRIGLKYDEKSEENQKQKQKDYPDNNIDIDDLIISEN